MKWTLSDSSKNLHAYMALRRLETPERQATKKHDWRGCLAYDCSRVFLRNSTLFLCLIVWPTSTSWLIDSYNPGENIRFTYRTIRYLHLSDVKLAICKLAQIFKMQGYCDNILQTVYVSCCNICFSCFSVRVDVIEVRMLFCRVNWALDALESESRWQCRVRTYYWGVLKC